MASLNPVKLAIVSNTAAGTSKCTVTCKVRFEDFEVTDIHGGMRFRADCKLWEADLGDIALDQQDDVVFSYASKSLSGASIQQTETVTFEQTISTSKLADDLFGAERIYAVFSLKNMNYGGTRSKKSNVIERNF